MEDDQSNTPLTAFFIPSELISLILSFLPVKTITQFKCVNKSWNTLISDPTFVKLHFNNSSQNPHLITSLTNRETSVVSLRLLLINPSNVDDTFRCPIKTKLSPVISSCNGLLFLLFWKLTYYHYCYWFYVWNPATRTISDKLGFFRHHSFVFTFGCDYLTGTYKVVALNEEREVKVFNLGDNCWRKIQSFPFAPQMGNHGVHLSGTVNWLVAIHGDYAPIEVGGKYVIVSLDLSTETYTHFLIPNGFNEVTCVKPSLEVLMDCLCFLYNFNRTEFVIWQMKEFGVQESWTLLFRIPYFDLQMRTPLYLSKNGDTLIFTDENDRRKIIIYKWRDKRVESKFISKKINRFSAIEYAESLVPTPWKSRDIKKRKVKTKRKVNTKRRVIYKIARD